MSTQNHQTATTTFKKPILIPKLSTERAEHELARWSQVTITHNYGAEPPLSLILALLLYKVETDGQERNGYQKNPLNNELRAFFTQVRLRRVVEALISGEAGEGVRAALQEELNRTGVGSLRMGAVPIHYFHRAYIKTRLLQCFDPRDLEILCHRRQESTTYAANLYESMTIDLNELLELPLRDPFHERNHDYCHEGPYPVAIGEQRRLFKESSI
jgi:hypothetical protein